jgi:NAD(P)-dependent dehydrogenase (short-subunit alcohol dehydrogenase family)
MSQRGFEEEVMLGEGRAEGVAMVTGGAGGMGSACARKLVREGWDDLLLCDIHEGRLQAVAEELRAKGTKVEVLAGDVADPGWPAALLASLGGRMISALIHTAGLAPMMADPARILAVNLDATVRLVDAVRARMAPGSAAVLYASNSTYFPMPPEAAAAFSAPLPPGGTAELLYLAPSSQIAYPLSKLGVRALVKREAKRFGERSVRLISISPGAVDTPMTRDEIPNSKEAKAMIRDSASGRIGRPEEIAAVSVFLCSPEASFCVAADWLVDGGHTAAVGF